MRGFRATISILSVGALVLAAAVYAASGGGGQPQQRTTAGLAAVAPLKEAKLNIEHNATDKDTGFQGYLDSEGWRRLDVRGPAAECSRSRGTARSQSWG